MFRFVTTKRNYTESSPQMEPAFKIPEHDLDPLEGLACALDTETTGLNPKIDRIISFGYVEIVDGRIGKTVEWFFNPGSTPIHPDALRVHGLTTEFLSDKPPIKAYLPKIIELVVEMIVCGHNLKFDLDMLDAELARHGFGPIAQYIAGVHDTMKEARKRWPGKPASLDAVCARLEIPTAHRVKHGALVDAVLCAEALLAMRRGQRSLLDLQTAPEATQAAGPGHAPAGMAPILVHMADAGEQAAHEQYLADLAASGTEPLWPDPTDPEEQDAPRPH